MTEIIELTKPNKELSYQAFGRYDYKKDVIYYYAPEIISKLVKAHEGLHQQHYKKHFWLRIVWELCDYRVFIGLIFLTSVTTTLASYFEFQALQILALIPIVCILIISGLQYWEEDKTAKEAYVKVFELNNLKMEG